MAINDEPQFNGGIIGSDKPVISPVMRELVRRGLLALPKLIDHLSDPRPTELVVDNGFSGRCFSDEYDARHHNPKGRANGVNTEIEINFQDEYTLKVGDLCFVAVGQIVNRNLNAVRYQPTLCLVINSPVKTPALATAIKADWSKLTPTEHEKSLVLDAHRLDYDSPAEALKRLWFYYPKTGERLILEMLNRPLYDKNLTYDFFENILVPLKNVDEAGKLLRDFRIEKGEPNYLGVLFWLVWASTFPEDQMDVERHKNKEVADKLLKRLFVHFDPYHPPFLNATTLDENKDLVNKLAAIHFPAKDDALFQMLQQAGKAPPESDVALARARCHFASLCAQQLDGQDKYRAGCVSVMKKLISDYQTLSKTQKSPDAFDFDQQLEMYRQSLDNPDPKMKQEKF